MISMRRCLRFHQRRSSKIKMRNEVIPCSEVSYLRSKQIFAFKQMNLLSFPHLPVLNSHVRQRNSDGKTVWSLLETTGRSTTSRSSGTEVICRFREQPTCWRWFQKCDKSQTTTRWTKRYFIILILFSWKKLENETSMFSSLDEAETPKKPRKTTNPPVPELFSSFDRIVPVASSSKTNDRRSCPSTSSKNDPRSFPSTSSKPDFQMPSCSSKPDFQLPSSSTPKERPSTSKDKKEGKTIVYPETPIEWIGKKKSSFFVFFLFLARNKHEDGRHERRKPEKHERPKNSGTSSEKSPTKSKSRKNETLLQHHEFQFLTDFRYRTKTSSDVAVAPIQFSRSFHRFEQKRESGPQIRKWTFEDKR